eukprot:gene24917-33410_t
MEDNWMVNNGHDDEDAETVEQDSQRSSDQENDLPTASGLDTSQNTVSMYKGGRMNNGRGASVAFEQNSSGAVGDVRLPPRADDPRVKASTSRGPEDSKRVRAKGKGRNTESFDPKSTIVRPDEIPLISKEDLAISEGICLDVEVYNRGPLRHDDVVIVPDFFCREDDWDIYYRLIDEMRHSQGAHLISQNPSGSPTFAAIQSRISQYFGINNKKVGTRFNWYRDASDWKPFHHDSAAFNQSRAQNQNITVGVSFGATRELAFLHAATGNKIYFPQTNGMMFSFGRDVNISWKHGINALSAEEQRLDPRGRISIVLWGLCPPTMVQEEDHSPPMLTDNTRGNGYSVHGPGEHRTGAAPKEARSADAKAGSPRGPPPVQVAVSNPNPNPTLSGPPPAPARKEIRREAAYVQVQQLLRGAAEGGDRGDRSGRQRGPPRGYSTNMRNTSSSAASAMEGRDHGPSATAVRSRGAHRSVMSTPEGEGGEEVRVAEPAAEAADTYGAASDRFGLQVIAPQQQQQEQQQQGFEEEEGQQDSRRKGYRPRARRR